VRKTYSSQRDEYKVAFSLLVDSSRILFYINEERAVCTQECRRGRGEFLGPDELARFSALRISDVLRRIRGVDVLHPGGNLAGVTEYFLFSSASAMCRSTLQQPIVYVDGMLFDVQHLLSFQVEDLIALEVYNGASEVPAEFNRTGSDCGVIVLWTR